MRRSTRLILWIASAVLYLAAFAVFVERLGAAISPLAALPILLGGWFFGMRAGIAMALAFVPLNVGLLAIAGVREVAPLTSPGYLAILVVGAGAGRIRDLGHALAMRSADDAQQATMHGVLAKAPLHIVRTTGPQHRISYVNERARIALGRDVIGMPVAELGSAFRIPNGAISEAIGEALDRAYADGTPFELLELWVEVSPSGARRYLNLRCDPSRSATGAVQGLILYVDDVTEPVVGRLALVARERQQAAVAAVGRRALAGGELSGISTAACEAVREVLGVDVVQIDEAVPQLEEIGRHAVAGSDGDSVERGTLARRALFTQEECVLPAEEGAAVIAHAGGPVTARGVAVVVRGVGRVFGVLTAYSRLPRAFTVDEVFFLSSIASVVAGATDRRAGELALEHQALYDALTGLPNRRLLQDRLQQAMLDARRHETETALLVIDLDDLKLVNDAHGHDTGDRLLEQVAQRFRALMRETDTVARLAGDEFAIVATGLRGPDDLSELVDRIADTFSEPFAVGMPLRIGASIGSASTPRDGADPATLMRRAEVAMHAAKRRNVGFRAFTVELDRDAEERLALASDLQKALDERQLSLVYQPKVEMATGRVVGVEALVRWRHPQLGPIPPERFVAAAEGNGLIDALTAWVLDTAAESCYRWRRQGHDFGMSVNVSMLNLRDESLDRHIAALMAVHECPPDALTLEITESATTGELVKVAARLAGLRAQGLRLSIDDYGTAYASLQHVRQLPVQEVKIDRSFVGDLLTNASSAAIVRSTIDLAHGLGLTVVAEGVETSEVWDRLLELGCDVAQGFLIARALPADELDEWIAARDAGPSARPAGVALPA